MTDLSCCRKLRIDEPISWQHHRGGWKYVVALIERHLHAADGVRFLSSVEDVMFRGEVMREPWVGFIHQVPRQHYNFPDLERLLQMDTWQASIDRCAGLWVLSTYVKEYLEAQRVPVPVARVLYPAETPDPDRRFSSARLAGSAPRKVLFIGEFLRDYRAFYELRAAPGYEKVLLRCFGFDPEAGALTAGDAVRILEAVSDEEYDRLLSESVVFLKLLDAPANTTIVECIVRGTPVLVNRVGGVAEYLGEDYPFYYDTLEEATAKLEDRGLIAATVDYLERWHLQEKLSGEGFLAALQNTAIYRDLPVPRSQRADFKSFDLTVVVCAYRRVRFLRDQLERLARQTFAGTFEVILWNNNPAERERIDGICAGFRGRLELKVIHSSENFYCIIRFAVASLMRSELLLICDDDVRPERHYIETFVAKYRQYGPDAALCARGHIFLPHELDEEEPQRAWETGEHMIFCDERVADCPVHFLHADNCLIPRYLLHEASRYEMERYEFALVDDYWLSFVLSHCLEVPIWKIRAAGAFTFRASADDPKVALFHNPRVREQRIDFYVYHMRHGWPRWAGSPE